MHETIVERLRRIAARTPEAPALSWRASRWSYGELQRAIEAVHAALDRQRVEPGSRVALLIRNSPPFVAMYYGALAAGCVVVPLNAQERAAVLARQLEHSETSILAGDPEHPEWPAVAAAARDRQVRVLEVAVHDGESGAQSFVEGLGDAASPSDPVRADRNDLAVIIYTSGTTGRPKGVMLSHGNLAANTQSIISYLGLTSADSGLCVLPFHFSYGSSVLHTHLTIGARLVLEDNFAFPQVTLQRIQDERVTGFFGVPATFALLLGRCRLRDFDLQSLRYITQAGGAMPRPLIQRLREEVPGVQIYIMYGQTEATARLTFLPPAQLETKLGSVGVPVPGVEIDVRRDGQSLPAGEIGEICARGPNVMLGYWGDPEATSQVIVDGWLHTGDLGHRDGDGYLYIDGRAVDMIKVGAFRVSPQEVEEVIAALDGVEEVGVAAIPDEMLGQSIKAVIVLKAGARLDARAVKAHCRQQLAAYKVPKIIEFATTLPRTSSGKIQRYKLA